MALSDLPSVFDERGSGFVRELYRLTAMGS